METRLELCNGIGEDYEQLLSVCIMSKDNNGVAMKLGASIGIKHIDSVAQVVEKLRSLANAFEDADKRIKKA